MIVVNLFCREDGVVKECRANGHAFFSSKGSDIVCAAVTILLKTAVSLVFELSKSGEIKVEADLSRRGNLAFRVDFLNEASEKTQERLRCIADFVRSGVSSIEKEFPKNVHLIEERDKSKNTEA